MTPKGEQADRAAAPIFPVSSRDSAILPPRSFPRGSAGPRMKCRDCRTLQNNTRYAQPPQIGKPPKEGWADKTNPGIRKSPFPSRNFYIFAPRGVPWGPGDIPRAAHITNQHPMRGATDARPPKMGAKPQGKRPTRESLNFRILVVIPLFLRSEAFRGTFRGEMTLTPNAKRGGDKYAKPP